MEARSILDTNNIWISRATLWKSIRRDTRFSFNTKRKDNFDNVGLIDRKKIDLYALWRGRSQSSIIRNLGKKTIYRNGIAASDWRKKIVEEKLEIGEKGWMPANDSYTCSTYERIANKDQPTFTVIGHKNLPGRAAVKFKYSSQRSHANPPSRAIWRFRLSPIIRSGF